MRRALLGASLALALGAPAQAGTVSGQLASPSSRLDVVYLATGGQRDEVRVLPHASGVRIVDAHGIVAGPFCFAVNENDARCGPPAAEGITVTAHTGDRADLGFTRVGSLMLESGDDAGLAYGASVLGGPGEDELRGLGDGAVVDGGRGDDELLGAFGDQVMLGGPGNDLVVGSHGDDELTGGQGRDQLAGGPGDDFVRATDPDRDFVACGAGRDRAFVSPNDRVAGCELVHHAWPG